MGVSNYQPLSRKDVSVDASSSKVVDSVLTEIGDCVDFHLCCKNEDETLFKSLKLSAQRVDSDVIDQVYGRMGDVIDFAVSTVLNGQNLELSFQNNEAFNLKVSLTRLRL